MDDKRIPLTSKLLPEIRWRKCAPVQIAQSDDTQQPAGHEVMIDSELDDNFASYQVYRYCSIPEALSLLSEGRWSFQHPSSWHDPYEKHVSSKLFGAGGPFQKVGVFAKGVSLDFRSNALRSMYAGKAGVVRIGFSLQELVAMLGGAVVTHPDASNVPLGAKFYLARCRYMEPSDLRREAESLRVTPGKLVTQLAMRAMAMKRDGFQYENEVRLAMFLKRPAKDACNVRYIQPHRVPIRGVLVDPYLESHDAEPLVALFQKLAPGALVKHSSFNASPAG
jgi:hypothetical protein